MPKIKSGESYNLNVENEGRLYILDYLRKELIGPVGGNHEEIEGSPHNRYTMGILFPINVSSDDELKDEEIEASGSGVREEIADDPVTLAGQFMPSSMGISFFFIGKPELEVFLYGAKYIKVKESRGVWLRKAIAEEKHPEKIIVNPEADYRCNISVLNSSASIQGHWRKLGNGYLVTISLVNSTSRKSIEIKGEDCLCQTGFHCRVPFGQIQEYPSVSLITNDSEEQELQLLYRRNKVFAIGHGCSVNWHVKDGSSVILKTEVMPTAFVPTMSHSLDSDFEILKIAKLADREGSRSSLLEQLNLFVDSYESWISSLDMNHEDIPSRLEEAKKRIKTKLHSSLTRMRTGIKCLTENDFAWESFQLANLAMLMQMRHSKNDLAGGNFKRNEINQIPENYLTLEYQWRPFQLAFQLLTIESLANQESEFRNVADLIWFPTGGGKTEAYLTLAAFEIFYRRLLYGERGAGTSVITRYTLRLLTSQQFQRAARLIAVCEFIRRKNFALGGIPITIGFWAGADTSPNTFDEASKNFAEILESPSPLEKNCFQIDSCPWCGTQLLPERNTNVDKDFGFICTNTSFQIFCPSEQCHFHEFIPVSVVDEDLYKNPPTFFDCNRG